MKNRSLQILSLLLAAMLQLAPLMRSLLPTQGLAPSAWGFILKIGVGATALLGFDAVSQASSMSLSPANATVGSPYSGVISYSGHSSSVSSAACDGNCLAGGSSFVTNGLTVAYDGAHSITINGTPTKTNTLYFSATVYERTSCGSGNSYGQTLALLVNPAGGAAQESSFTAAPQNQIAQVGTAVDLSGGASGNPIPTYQWWQGQNPIVGQTSSVLHIASVALTNAGTYTLTASNSLDVGKTILTGLPSATCILSTCISGGTNFSALNYTNFAPAGVALSIYSYVTNAAIITNNYNWYYNGSGVSISPSNTLPISAVQLTPAKSGDYSVLFTNSLTNASGSYVGQVIPPSGTNVYNFKVTTGQWFDSYWAFGYLPMFTNALPASTNVNAGANVTFTLAVGGTLNVYNAYGGSTYITNQTIITTTNSVYYTNTYYYTNSSYFTNTVDPCVFWYQNGNLVAAQNYVLGPVSGTTYSNSAVNATLTLTNVSAANNGNYTVVVTNFWGSLTSSPVALTVASSASPPGFTANPPAALSLLAGQSSPISVTVTGTPPLAYQWQRNGANLANGGVYAGVLTNALTLTAVTTANAGNYTVAVTNTAGAVTSSVAMVNIASPPAVTAGAGTPGQLQLSANTLTGLTYVVQMTTNLAAPVWTPILTNITGSAGTINFQTNTTAAPSQFYQLRFP